MGFLETSARALIPWLWVPSHMGAQRGRECRNMKSYLPQKCTCNEDREWVLIWDLRSVVSGNEAEFSCHPFCDLPCLWGAWGLVWGAEKRASNEGEEWTLTEPVEESSTSMPHRITEFLVLGQVLQKSDEGACRGTGPKRGLYPFIFTFWFFVIQCLISFVKHAPPPPLRCILVCVSLLLPHSYFCPKHQSHRFLFVFRGSFPSVLSFDPSC